MGVDCSSAFYSVVLYPIKNIMNLIMIIGPILLIISLVIMFTKMTINPDEKKGLKKIFNSIMALAILIFISCIVNASMYILGGNTNVTKCWNSAKKVNLAEKYYDVNDNKKNKVIIDSDKFESGKERVDNNSSSTGNNSSSSSNSGSISGSLSTTTSDRTTNARNAAVNWAINIANDDDFHYGQDKWAHHGGCYFCDKGYQKAKIKDGASVEESAKTYVCSTLITAAYHHGAGSNVLKCHGGLLNSLDGGGVSKKLRSELTQVRKPSKLSDCIPGDIFITTGHVCMYIGNGKIVEAASGGKRDVGIRNKGWNDSIAVRSYPDSRYKKVAEVWRYTGVGKF